ncbi:MAG: hypothetical protein ACJAYU_002909 [Bradymonadia bacterium]|jgi:hypothetical protein
MKKSLLLLSSLCLVACGDEDPVPSEDSGSVEDTGSDTGESDATDVAMGSDAAADSGTDPTEDVVEDAPPEASIVTFRLVNQNPGGLSRFVQVVGVRGTPSWYNVMPAGSLDDFLRIHDTCTLCNCDDLDCEECEPEPEIIELAPGESVTAIWDGSLVNFDQDLFCEEPGMTEETALQVQFVWSPVPPDESGALPIGTLSRTRLQFELGVDEAVTYEIEVLAEE